MIYSFSRNILKFFYRVLFRIEIFGSQYIPEKDAVIIVCNHCSYLDPPCVGFLTKRQVNFMVKKKLFDKFMLGWWAKKTGYIPVNKKKRHKEHQGNTA